MLVAMDGMLSIRRLSEQLLHLIHHVLGGSVWAVDHGLCMYERLIHPDTPDTPDTYQLGNRVALM